MGPPIEIKSWTKILQYWAKGDPQARETTKRLMRHRLNGYTAVTDAPCSQLVPELLEIYPDAKVICNVRDPEAWAKSLAQIWSLALMWFLRGVLLPLPSMRHFPSYISLLSVQWRNLYGQNSEDHGVNTYKRLG
ncbi:NAD dependent epimerase/dehydratase [Penicillium argentinense]|uniref:NAD dependent epimerase/dehydratase n=1 Tax=Penicillium argentinense TaxID=1131581 RepID=A0A9W9EIC0_9EURO|nr:NAD dependent epimerase/dehydratase [Penicillium argentinense]KAJ5082353.1 NAD dependent epimerase/dehydratase [Penicillium argentinense]